MFKVTCIFFCNCLLPEYPYIYLDLDLNTKRVWSKLEFKNLIYFLSNKKNWNTEGERV